MTTAVRHGRSQPAVLADGFRSPAILEDLARFEKQLAEIRESASAAQPEKFALRMHDARRFVESRMEQLQGLFAAEGPTIRAELSKHVQNITLTPEGHTYIASGTWDVLGAWQHGWCRGPESLVRAHYPVQCSTRGMMQSALLRTVEKIS